MGTVERAGTAVVSGLFLAALLLRPLRSNPGVAAAVEDGFTWPTVLWLPLVGVSLLVVAVRLGGVVGDGADEQQEAAAGRSEDSSQDGDLDIESGWLDEDEESEAADDTQGGVAFVPEDAGALRRAPAADARPVRQRPVYGLRLGEANVEQRPPEAPLAAHLEHLRAELDDDGQVGEDLREFERVARSEAEENPIPDRCPAAHCDARWTERSVLGINTGRYEVLEDGRVCCLECESVVSVEGVE